MKSLHKLADYDGGTIAFPMEIVCIKVSSMSRNRLDSFGERLSGGGASQQ
jgi:hypothetical protein